MKNKLLRQGDVLLKRASVSLPLDAAEVKDCVLARGEATGHSHRVEGAKVFRTTSGQLLVQVEKAATVVHEEHGRLELEEGVYEVTAQREYSPVEERRVSD